MNRRSYYESANTASLLFDLVTGAELVRMPLTEGPQMVLMAFGSSGATTADSGTTSGASYTFGDLQASPRLMSMTFSLTAGASNSGSAVMISTALGNNDIDYITNGSVHIVSTENYVNVGYYNAGSLTNTQFTYATALTKDGATKYALTARIFSDKIVCDLPDGTTATVTSVQFAAKAGRYCGIESYAGASSGTRATFYAATFERFIA